MPKKFEDYLREAQEGKGLTQEEYQLLQSINDRFPQVTEVVRRIGNDDLANDLGDFFGHMTLMSGSPESYTDDGQKELWQKSNDGMAGFDDFLNDNFDTIMKAGMRWSPPAFGNNGKDFFDWLSVINTKFGVSIEKTLANHPEIRNEELAAEKMNVWRPPVSNINLKFHQSNPQKVIDAFGPNATNIDMFADKEEIKAVTFNDVMETGLSDRFVTAAVIGATYDPAILHVDDYGDKGAKVDNLHFAQSNLLSNIASGDHRFAHYSKSLLDGRMEARKAFDEYKKENYEPLKTILGRFLKKAARGATESRFNLSFGNHEVEREEIQLAKDILEADLPFDVKELVTETELVHLKAGIAQNEANLDRDQRIHDFISNPSAPGSPEREEALSEIFLDMYIAQISEGRSVQALDDGCKRTEDVRTEAGIENPNANLAPNARTVDEDGTDYDVVMNGKAGLYSVSGIYRDAQRQFTVSPEEVTLSMENGRDALKEAYLDQIKETAGFKALLYEHDPAKLKAGFEDARNVINRNNGPSGFDLLYPEELPGDAEAARLNEQNKPELDKRFKEADDTIKESVAQHLKRNETVSNLKDWTKELNSKRLGLFNNSSGEMDTLREKTADVIKVLGTNFKEGARLDSPEGKQALRELRDVAAEYIKAKQLPHGKVGDEKWEPGTPMGRDRFRAAKKIHQLMEDLLGESWKKGIVEVEPGLEKAPENAKENKADELDQPGGGIKDEPEAENDLEIGNKEEKNIENEAGESSMSWKTKTI